MRLLFATLLAFALLLLPAAGAVKAETMTSSMAAGGSCHDMPVEHQMPADKGQACAEHCMMLVSPLPALTAGGQPSIGNAICAERTMDADSRAPRAGEPPETPPPRR